MYGFGCLLFGIMNVYCSRRFACYFFKGIFVLNGELRTSIIPIINKNEITKTTVVVQHVHLQTCNVFIFQSEDETGKKYSSRCMAH